MSSTTKFEVEVILVLAAVSKFNKQDNKFLVTKNGKFPSRYLILNKTSKQMAFELLEEYSGVTPEWALLSNFGIYDEIDIDRTDRKIQVLYGCFIPEPTRIRINGSKWINPTELDKENRFEKNM
jgi:hypothetical protein